ncbi:MAG: DNA polymerase III subunit delta [Candidatus Absconditabacterales bacterium]
MLNNVYLFTGEEKYLLNNELFRRRDNFAIKFGAESIFSFNVENFDLEQFKQSVYGGGLFSSKKLIIFFGLPIDTDKSNKLSLGTLDSLEKFIEDFIKNLGKIPEDALLLFVSYKPDKRVRFYKFLSENAQLKEFKKLKGIQLKDFVRQQLSGLKISDEAIEYLLIKIGDDLYRIYFECEKLKIWCDFKSQKEIDTKIIDYITFGDVQTDSFTFLDNLLSSKKKAIGILDKIKEDGINWNLFAGMLYRGLKIYIYILDLYKQGITDSKQITSILKIHPFVVSKNLKNIEKIKESEKLIKKIYRNLVELDYNIKTGKLPDTYFWLGIKKFISE